MSTDLTTRFVPYLAALRVSAAGSLDLTTLLSKDIPIRRAADADPDDLNSTYSRQLSPVPALAVLDAPSGPAWFEAPDSYFERPAVPAKKAAPAKKASLTKRAVAPRRKA